MAIDAGDQEVHAIAPEANERLMPTASGAVEPVKPEAMAAPALAAATETATTPPTTIIAEEVAAPTTAPVLDSRIRDKDAQVTRLSKQLQHYRSWVASVHLRVQHMNPKAIQNAKRLYVGNLPPAVTEEEICAFMNQLMLQTGAQVGPEPAVMQCHLTQERNFAFAEFRSVEEASNAMGLDGVAWKDTVLKIRRPSNYDLATSLMLGPITPDPTMDVSCLNLSKPVPEESPNKLFVGGLPCEWPEQAVRMILEPFGPLKHFNLVMDKATGNSKGYAFCEFVDEGVTDSAIAGLNGQRAGTKTLTVKRAAEGARQSMASIAPGSSSGISPQPTPMSQPSSFDDPSSSRGAGSTAVSHMSSTFPVTSSGMLSRKSTSSGQTIQTPTNALPGSGSGAAYIMAPQPMGAMIMSGMAPAPRASPGYPGGLGMGRPMATSHDSHMAHMQQHMVQPFMAHPGQAHPMHYSPGGMGAMMMPAPAGMMMQAPTHYSSVDHIPSGVAGGSVGSLGNRSVGGKAHQSSGGLMRGMGSSGSGNLSGAMAGMTWNPTTGQQGSGVMPTLRQGSSSAMPGSKGAE